MSRLAQGPWRLSPTPARALAPSVRYFSQLGLLRLDGRQEVHPSNCHGRDPYVQWCGTRGVATCLPIQVWGHMR